MLYARFTSISKILCALCLLIVIFHRGVVVESLPFTKKTSMGKPNKIFKILHLEPRHLVEFYVFSEFPVVFSLLYLS